MDDSVAVDAYLAGLPEPHRELLAHVRATIHDACPDATEGISYSMPTFRLHGKPLVWYAGFKKHCSLFPASAMVMTALGDSLAPFVTEKATIRFTADRPLPDDLLRRLVAVRVVETAQAPAG